MTTRREFLAVLVASVAMLAIIAGTASAQLGPPPNLPPPCVSGNLVVNNASGCTVDLCLKATPPINPWCFTIPVGAIGWPVTLPAGTTIGGIISLANIGYPFVPHPFLAGIWWVQNVNLGPFPGCCCDVYYDPANCTMRITPTTGGPPCQP